MKLGSTAWHLLAILGASATVTGGMTACAPRNADINQVQPGYVRKSIFQTNDEWYYRRTIAKGETTNEIIIEGHGDIALERVRWKVQENVLLAYKPYEAIPGSSTAELEGATDFEGPVLAAFPIVSHFDIIRGYDALTGNETNLITENATDRPWYEREFMRVDWARNLADNSYFSDYSGYWIPVSWVSTGAYWSNLETMPTDEFASRFSDDYVEVTHNAFLGMDLLMCAAFVGYSWAGYGNCGFGEAQVRHAFRRVTEKSDFIPVAYPDSVVKKGADGNPVYDDETGEVAREPIYNRFGIFRLETPTFDRGYGHTESGRLFRAMLFNLWERHTDSQGNVLPERDRTPKPIIYYLNADYPARYRLAAAEVAAEYSRIYTSMTVDLKCGHLEGGARDACAAQVPAMFEIRDNDCNEARIVSFVSQNPDYLFAVERAACKEGSACSIMNADDVAKEVGFGNLTKVCTSLEAATLDPTTGKSEFDWQRIGDPRYNMVVWLNNPQFSPWGGYGPMHADARTGETVSATAFLRGFSYEVGAANVADYIEFMNDERTVSDIIYGQDIRKHATQVVERYRQITSARPGERALSAMRSRVFDGGLTKSELLKEVPNRQHLSNRLERAKGTRVEEFMVNEFDLAMAGEGKWNPKDEITQDLRDRASPLGRVTYQNPTSAVQRRAQAALASSGFCFLQQEFDPHYAGLAFELRNLSREERYRIISARLIKHVMLHELGHNVGLAHNFEGSYDALNYDDRFWNLHWAPERCQEGDDSCDPSQTKVGGKYDEYRHTTVMEYMSMKGLFSDFLGKYDEAAIRFAYGNQVAVFDNANVDPNLQGGEALREWRYYNDYTRIPAHILGQTGPDGKADRTVCDGENQENCRQALRERRWVKFDVENPPQNEVPFLFCDNYFNRATPYCATFDYGSNMKEIFANFYSMWSNYFFFNNFIRDRLTPLAWSPNRAIVPIFYSYSFVDVVAQYYYYQSVADPAFRGSDIESDMLAALEGGLNMAAEVISTPEPQRMCPWPGADPTVYLPGIFLNDCDEYAPIDSRYAIDAQAIQLPLGDARPASLSFTEDYEEWDWALVGSYFDKSNVLLLLGWTSPTLFRFNYDLDLKNYYISLYRLFEPELRQFYGGLLELDGFFLRQSTAQSLGSFWCRDSDNPTLAYLGHFEPRRMIQLTDEGIVAFPGASDECLEPAYIYPTLLANMPYQAMFYAHALFSSDFDARVDMGKNLKVFVVGADDDYVDWSGLQDCTTAPPNTSCFCGMTDALTGLEYRAIQVADPLAGGTTQGSLGCRLINLAADAQRSYQSQSGNPFYQDNWRSWIERLEYARDLYRLFHHN